MYILLLLSWGYKLPWIEVKRTEFLWCGFYPNSAYKPKASFYFVRTLKCAVYLFPPNHKKRTPQVIVNPYYIQSGTVVIKKLKMKIITAIMNGYLEEVAIKTTLKFLYNLIL